jgi:pilus assembly protein CpaB
VKNKKVILIAGILALFAAILTISLVGSLERKYRESARSVEVLKAKGYIPEGTLLTQYMVEVTKVPLENKQPKALDKIEQLVNENGVNIYATLVPIEAGEQVLMTKLVTAGKDTGLAIIVPEGRRAVTISVDAASGVADLIRPGNTVDVICTMEEQGKAVTVLQNALVLAYKQNILGGQKSSRASASGSPADLGDASAVAPEDIPASVTIAVTPVEAQALALASIKGTLRLSLRGLNDNNVVNMGATTMGIFSK